MIIPIRKCLSAVVLLPFFICHPWPVRAQDIPSAPPADVIAAAVSAFPEYDNGQTYDSILKYMKTPPDATTRGETIENPIEIQRTSDTQPNAGASGAPVYPSSLIVRLVSRSDFVGVGIPLKRWSYPTKEKSFAVSIVLVQVSVSTMPGKENIAQGSYFYVVRAGGSFTYKGKYFQAIETDLPPLHLNEPSVFFAKQISPGLYKADASGILKVEGSSVVETSLAHRNAEYLHRRSLNAILDEANNAWRQSRTAERGDK